MQLRYAQEWPDERLTTSCLSHQICPDCYVSNSVVGFFEADRQRLQLNSERWPRIVTQPDDVQRMSRSASRPRT